MVIACEHCNTRFQLDDARVPETGVRVRCSRCKHSFFVAPPGGGDEALHAVAAEAAQSAAPSVPTSTEDLPPPAAEAAVQPGSAARSGGDVEEDWQFNLPGEGEPEEQSSAGFASAASGLAAPSEPAGGPGGEPTPPPNAPLPNSAFESSAGDASPGFIDEDPGAPGLGDSSHDGAPDDSDLRDQLFGDDPESPVLEDSPIATEAEAEAEADAEAGGGDDQFFGHSDQALGGDPEEPETVAEEA
ncbi:MAG: zinc-ribbon domain-containing protein, partial [Myxococcota bacterium]